MSSPPDPRARSGSTSSNDGDERTASPRMLPPRNESIGRPGGRPRRPHSQSSPALASRGGRANGSASTARTNSSQQLPYDAFPEQTWVEFLRGPEAGSGNGSPQPSSSHSALPARPTPTGDTSHSSERKRRLTRAESPAGRPSSTRMRSNTAGQSASNPIVLDSSPARTASSPQRDSDIVLPKWQPDAEVSRCPVCRSQFTFFYRKHHCRKCGRVVCSACSPHRITIPRQFIVQPPADNSSSIIDLTEDDDLNYMSAYGPFRGTAALGGGEEVRVCNPCVPDPNYSPPPQYPPTIPSRHSSYFPPTTSFSQPQPDVPRGHSSSQSVNVDAQTLGHGRPRPRDPQRFASGIQSGQDDFPHAQQYGHSHAHPRPFQNPGLVRHHQHAPNDSESRSARRASMFSPSIFQTIRPHQQTPQSRPQPQRQSAPRRQIAEEDECPICGRELPPKGPNGDETARTQHVEECIALHSSSPPPTTTPNQTSTSLPTQRTRGMSTAGNGEGASNPNRMSHAARGMVLFQASEKDCLDEEGQPAECIICFEEFEQGNKMGRLVCWCKFHEHCIKEWWKKKGRGACPTHQLHE